MKHHLFFYLLLSLTTTYGQFDTKMRIEYSESVDDSFEVYISLPASYNLKDTYNVVYYCDANLKSGRYLRESISTSKYPKLERSIFVGIGHMGNFHVLRRRDFILPTITAKDTVGRDEKYGQTEKFYTYLKNELLPSINAKFQTNTDSNSIIGHSLGGLFAFYCLFKSDDLFSKYFALSPALWIDKYSIYKFNKIHIGFDRPKYLYFSAGSKETINRILRGTNEAKEFLDKKRYGNLAYEYDVWKGETHNSQVALSLDKIFREKL